MVIVAAQRRIETIADADVDALDILILDLAFQKIGDEGEACARLEAGIEQKRLIAVLLLHGLDLRGALFKSLVPADGNEFSRATLADALERRLDAGISIDMLDFGNALQAYRVEALLARPVVWLDLHQAAIAHRAFERTVSTAVPLVERVCGFFLRRIGVGCIG